MEQDEPQNTAFDQELDPFSSNSVDSSYSLGVGDPTTTISSGTGGLPDSSYYVYGLHHHHQQQQQQHSHHHHSSSQRESEVCVIPEISDDIIHSNEESLAHKGIPRLSSLVPPRDYQIPGNFCKSIHQLAALKHLFETNPLPKRDTLTDFCLRTGLDYRECLQWLKGQRGMARKKKNNETSEESFLPKLDSGASIFSPVKPLKQEKVAADAFSHSKKVKLNSWQLSKTAIKRSREWAVHYSLVDDLTEKEYMINCLVDQLDIKRRKELRNILVKEPLGLNITKDFKVRKSSADPSLSRDALISRADSIWDFIVNRLGCCEKVNEDELLDEEGNILLDAAVIIGLESMFSRHRDYFMALVHRFGMKGILACKEAKQILGDGDITKTSSTRKRRRKMNV